MLSMLACVCNNLVTVQCKPVQKANWVIDKFFFDCCQIILLCLDFVDVCCKIEGNTSKNITVWPLLRNILVSLNYFCNSFACSRLGSPVQGGLDG